MTIDIKVIFVESESCYTVWLQCFMHIFALFFLYIMGSLWKKQISTNKQSLKRILKRQIVDTVFW